MPIMPFVLIFSIITLGFFSSQEAFFCPKAYQVLSQFIIRILDSHLCIAYLSIYLVALLAYRNLYVVMSLWDLVKLFFFHCHILTEALLFASKHWIKNTRNITSVCDE